MSSELHKRQQSAKIKTNILIATGIPMIMLILVSVFSLTNIHNNTRWFFGQSLKSLHTLSKIERLISELETGRIEYLVTGNEEIIKQLHESIDIIKQRLYHTPKKIFEILSVIEELTNSQIDARMTMNQITIENVRDLIMDESWHEKMSQLNKELRKITLISEKEMRYQFAYNNRKGLLTIMIITLLAIIISLSTSFYIARKLTMTLSGELHQKKQVFMQDNLSRQSEIKHGDEIARIAGALDTSAGELSKMAGLIQQLADSIKK